MRIFRTLSRILPLALLAAPALAQAPNYTTTVTLTRLLAAGSLVPFATVCAQPADIYGNAISVSALTWGLLLANNPACGNVVNGVLTGGLAVPDAAHTNAGTPIYYNFIVQITNSDGDPMGQQIVFKGVPNVSGTSWPLDDYTPVVNLPLPPSNVIGNGSSVPSSCTAPSLYTVGSNAYVCKNGVYVSINGQSFNLRGAWAANTAYNPYDVVTYAGSSLVATTTFTTGATYSSANWTVLAAGGTNALSDALLSSVTSAVLAAPSANQTITQPAGTSLGVNLLNGSYNADLYLSGSGNNGVGNLIASGGACHTGPCSIVIPATSTSTENVASLQLPDNVTVLDRRPGTLGSTLSNCLAAAGWCHVLSYNNSSSNNPYTFGLTINNNFKPQGGFNWGGGYWSGSHALTINSNYQTSGIEQDFNINDNYYSTGDKAMIYGYAYGNAGCTGASDECQKLVDVQGGQPVIVPGQTVPFYQASVASGMTAGVTWLQATQTLAQQNAMKFPSDGTMILDLNPAAALACNITGPDTSTTPLLAGSNVYSFPVDCTVPLSTAFGSIGAAMPQSNKGFTSTAAFSVELGPSSSAFVTGTATLAGDSSPERVSITAGAVTSGTPSVQQVTITYRWPNAAGGGTSLWQGGLDTMAISLDRNLARDGWPQAFAAVGAIDSSHIGYTINSEGSTYNNTLSYYLGPMQIVAISRNSSGLVTFLSNNVGAYSLQSTITIAGSGTTPSMDGACTNVKPLVNGAGNINGGTCQEATASAVTGTTATATIPGVNGIHLYPYADNIGPMVAGALHLGPNTVNWQPGDAIENPAYPIAQFTGLSLGVSMNTPIAASPSIGLDLQEHGSGTAGYYSSIRIGNYLPCQWLESCGGTLLPKTNVSVFGAYLTHENLQYSPFPGGSLINIGPSMTTSLPGGYDDLHGYCLFRVQNSSLCYNPATQAWLIPSILASSVSSLNLSVTGSAAIASETVSSSTIANAAICTLTAGGQSVCEVNGTNCGILTGTLTTTASASDAVTLTGLTSSSHCAALVPTNASASTVTGLYVTPSANTLTVFHNAAAGMTFAVMCTVY